MQINIFFLNFSFAKSVPILRYTEILTSIVKSKISQFFFLDADCHGLTGTIAGWGKLILDGSLDKSSTLPTVLQKLDVPILSNVQCRTKALYTHKEITDNMMCAGFIEGQKDACTVNFTIYLTDLTQNAKINFKFYLREIVVEV